MTLDLTAARAAMTEIFQTRTLRVMRYGVATTSACGLAPRSGAIARGVEGRDQERGAYVLTLPAETTLELQPDEEVTLDEVPLRRFVVVWAPPASNLNLARRYGVDEVR